MKKLLIIGAILLSVLTLNVKADEIELPPKTDHEVVKVYLFYGYNCSHCHEFFEFIQKNYKDEYKDYFEIVGFESWKNDGNSAFLTEVGDYFEIAESDRGVPFFLIGDDYTIGFASSMGQEIIEKALKQYENESYVDLGGELLKNTSKSVKQETLDEALVTAGIKKAKKEGTSDTVYIVIIFGVLVVGLGGLVLLSRKK